jgi:hypothetical protein
MGKGKKINRIKARRGNKMGKRNFREKNSFGVNVHYFSSFLELKDCYKNRVN